MCIYLVICLIKTIFYAVFNIIKGFKISLTIIFLDGHGRNCHLDFGNDKNQVNFYLRGSFGSATSSSVFLFIKLHQNKLSFSLHLSFDNVSITT